MLQNETDYNKYIDEMTQKMSNNIAEDYSQIVGIYTKRTIKNCVKTLIKRYVWKQRFDKKRLYHNIMIETHLWITQRWLRLMYEKHNL